jgi:hypothetical protein
MWLRLGLLYFHNEMPMPEYGEASTRKKTSACLHPVSNVHDIDRVAFARLANVDNACERSCEFVSSSRQPSVIRET